MRPNNRMLRKKRDTGVIRVFAVDDMVRQIKAEARAEEEEKEWEAERGSFVAEEVEKSARQRAEALKIDVPRPKTREELLAMERKEPEAPIRRRELSSAKKAAESEQPKAKIPAQARRSVIESRERIRKARAKRRRVRLFVRIILLAVICAAGFWFFDLSKNQTSKHTKEKKTAVTLPALKVKDLNIGYGKECNPEDFLKKIDESGEYSYSFKKNPDPTLLNKKQSVTVIGTDKDGNSAKGEADLMVVSFPGDVEVEAGTDLESALSEARTRFGTEEVEGFDYITTDHVDRFAVSVQREGTTYLADVSVVDTVAPVFAVKDLKCSVKYKAVAREFVTESEDATDITFSFMNEPDTSVKGKHALVIIGEDEGGNKSRHTAFLTLGKDEKPPVFDMAEDFTSFIGDSITYKDKVAVSDNFDGEIKIEVDSSKVDPTKEGTYPVKYTAIDAAGNKTEKEINITLADYTADEQEIIKKADEIIAQIITDDMSDRDKAWAIYEYILNHVSYVSSSEKGDYLKAARQGLINGSGDCYVYRSVAKLLLDEAHLTNMDIERIPSGDDMHYWNLVDVHDGHGWYHFDTTPRIDHPTIFLWDDAKIKEYSDSHNNCHNYDRSKYPHIS